MIFRDGANPGPASRTFRDGASLGPAARTSRDGAGLGTSRAPDAAASLGPASRVIREGNDGGASRTPPDAPRTGRTQAYELLHLAESDLVACVGPCLLVVSNVLTLEAVAAMARGMAKLVQRHGKLSSLSIVDRQSGPNTGSEARAAITEVVRKHSQSITGAAVVCDGTGFRATAIRSIVTAIHMASRSSHSSKVFAELVPAIEWLATTRSDGAIDVALLLEASQGLRAKLQERVGRAADRDGG